MPRRAAASRSARLARFSRCLTRCLSSSADSAQSGSSARFFGSSVGLRPTQESTILAIDEKGQEPRQKGSTQKWDVPAPWPWCTYMQKSAFNCFKTCADSFAPFSGIADTRRRSAPGAPHADLAILRWLPPNPGWGGLSKSTLLIILGTLTWPQCAGITPDPVCIPPIHA